MKTIGFNSPYFTDEDKARQYLEKIRWPEGPVCPHCGSKEDHYSLHGTAHRKGIWKCKKCRKQFSVTVGTVFERSHIPLHKWLLASYLLCSSKKGMSAHQLHRMLQLTYKTAWFMFHRNNERNVNDAERSVAALMGIEGKRLMYRDSSANIIKQGV